MQVCPWKATRKKPRKELGGGPARPPERKTKGRAQPGPPPETKKEQQEGVAASPSGKEDRKEREPQKKNGEGQPAPPPERNKECKKARTTGGVGCQVLPQIGILSIGILIGILNGIFIEICTVPY